MNTRTSLAKTECLSAGLRSARSLGLPSSFSGRFLKALFALLCLFSLLPSSSSADQFRIYIQRPGNPDRQLSTVRASDATTSGTLDFYSDDLTTSGTIELIGQDQFNIGGTPYPPPTPDLQEVTDVGATTTNFSTFSSSSGVYDGLSNLSLAAENHLRAGGLYGMAASPGLGAGTSDAGVMAFTGSGGPIPLRVESSSAYANDYIRVGKGNGAGTDAKFTVHNSGGLTAAGDSIFNGQADFNDAVILNAIVPATPIRVLVHGASNEIATTTALPLNVGGTGTSLGNGVSGQVITSNGLGAVTWTTPGTIPSAANPTATVNGTATNGAASTYMRSDAAPALANPFTPSGGTQTLAGSIIVQTDATVDGNYTLGDGGTDVGTLNGDITIGTGSGDTLAINSSTPTIANVPFDTTTPSVAIDGVLLRASTTNRIRGIDVLPDSLVTNALTISGGSVNNSPVGNTTASTGAFTTLSASSTLTGNGNWVVGDAGSDAFTSVATTIYSPDTAQDITAAATTITVDRRLKLVTNTSFGDVTVTNAPTIANGTLGQMVTILNVSALRTVTVQDQGTLGGSNLRLGATTRAIGPRDSLTILFNGSDWVEVTFTNVL